MNQNNRRSTDKLQKRPDVLGGCTYKIKWPSSEHALYVTINDFIGSDGVKKPFELFLNTKDPTHKDWMVFASLMTSAVWRREGDVNFVFEQMHMVFAPQGGAWVKGKYCPSVIACIGDIIEQHMKYEPLDVEGCDSCADEVVKELNGAAKAALGVTKAYKPEEGNDVQDQEQQPED